MFEKREYTVMGSDMHLFIEHVMEFRGDNVRGVKTKPINDDMFWVEIDSLTDVHAVFDIGNLDISIQRC